MKTRNTNWLSHVFILLTATLLLSACADNDKDFTTASLKVTSYNMGLALNFVPYTNERLVVNEELVADYDSDVICFQEVWLQDQVDVIKQALAGSYQHIYTVPPEQIYSDTAACTSEEIAEFENCARTQCDALSGGDLVSCGIAQCSAFFAELSPACTDGVIAAVGIPDLTIDILVETVTQPTGKFSYDGSLGLMLASKYTLQNREFQDFIEDSSGNHRGALYAEILLNDRHHVVGCTHPTANLAASIAYPPSGKHGSWEGENRFMQQQMIAYVNAKAGGNPIFFGGDFNCSIANPGNGTDAEFPANCQLWLDDGFVDPAAEQLPCTFCNDENLVLQAAATPGVDNSLLDHVFVKNLATVDGIRVERVFDDTVAIEALIPPSELQPEDSPLLMHPSDHFGVELDIELP